MFLLAALRAVLAGLNGEERPHGPRRRSPYRLAAHLGLAVLIGGYALWLAYP